MALALSNNIYTLSQTHHITIDSYSNAPDPIRTIDSYYKPTSKSVIQPKKKVYFLESQTSSFDAYKTMSAKPKLMLLFEKIAILSASDGFGPLSLGQTLVFSCLIGNNCHGNSNQLVAKFCLPQQLLPIVQLNGLGEVNLRKILNKLKNESLHMLKQCLNVMENLLNSFNRLLLWATD